MTSPRLCLAGKITQSDATNIKALAVDQIASGAVAISNNQLESIEFGALQVLLCAAKEAQRRGLPCVLDSGAASILDDSLAAMHLPDSTGFFTILPTEEVSASS